MAVTVVDSTNLVQTLQAGIDAQAAADGIELAAARKDATPAAKDEKVETKPTNGETDQDPDDVEGDDGLTPREKQDLLGAQRKDLPQSVHRVIAKRVAQRKAAEEFAAAQYSEKRLAEARAAAAEAALAELKAKAQPAEPAAKADTGKPQRDKFPADAAGEVAYWEAMTDWRVDEKLRAKDAERAAAEEQQRIDEMLAIARQKSALVPDFAEALQQATALDIRIPPIIFDYMLQTEMGAELSYHLAKNPKVVESLWKLKPSQQLVTIGKIESTLKPFEAKKPAAKDEDGATPGGKESTNGQQRTAAPSEDTGAIPSRARDTAPVIRPLNGSGASPAEVAPEDMNIRETIHSWEKKHSANFGLRKRH